MRHRVAHRKLGRTTQHRMSLLRNLAASLFVHERIRTTLVKAKELRPFAEKLITLSKKDSLHARRRALQVMGHREAVAKLFRDLSARFADRPGGYTRILKLGPRQGDGAEMAFIELVDFTFKATKEAPAKDSKEKAGAKPKAAEKSGVEPEADEEASAKETKASKGKKKGAKPAAGNKKKATKKSTNRKNKKKKD
ncbi:MAG: 50S ribosomal protein L17 [Vicinamibacteria bacterium]